MNMKKNYIVYTTACCGYSRLWSSCVFPLNKTCAPPALRIHVSEPTVNILRRTGCQFEYEVRGETVLKVCIRFLKQLGGTWLDRWMEIEIERYRNTGRQMCR